MSRLVAVRERVVTLAPLLAFVAVCALFTALNPTFASVANVKVVLGQAAVLMVVTLGMTTVVRTGGVDLSIAVAVDVGALVAAVLLRDGYVFWIALVGGLLAGVLVGAVNALLIVVVRMDPVLTTLGTLFVGQGAQQVYTKGGAAIFLAPADVPGAFRTLGTGTLLGLPLVVFVALGAIVAFWLLLERARFGRSLAAIGAQRPAAVVAGLRVRRDLAWAYVVSGVAGALAGIMLCATSSSYVPLAGYDYLLDAVGAVFVGTTMHREGRPNVLGSVVGVLFFGALANGMNLAGIPFQWQSIAKGGLLLFVLAANAALRRPAPVALGRLWRSGRGTVTTTPR